MESIRKILARRDNATPSEIDDMLDIARERILEGEDPEDVLEEEFGLEPDYIMDRELGIF